MATEDEARDAADGEEVQVEAADLGTTHLQMNLDRKLSSHEEIKGEAKITDSTEGPLKVTEDQVLEKAPSVDEIPAEDTPNGTASSLNGQMKEEKISNEKPQENGQKDDEQVEASSNGVSTDQSNNSNGEEAIDSSGHAESTTQDTSLLKHENEEPKEHYQQDVEGAAVEDKMVHEDTLQTEPTVDAQEGQNLEPAEVTEDTQDASTSCIPHDEVVAEAPAEVKTSLEPNVDDSDALPDATDGNTETEPAKVDKESCPEDEDVAEQTNEIIKPEDQPSKQTDDVDADLVQEEVPESKKTEVPEDMTKPEQAGESTNGEQEELNQQSPRDTSEPVHEKTEETSHESNVSASEETIPEHDATAREPVLDVHEVQSQGLSEEIADAKEVDTEKTVQQCGVASEEATPEDSVATIEPSSDIQHLNGVESEEIKVLEDAKAEDKESTEDIQPVQGLEEEPKSTGTVEMDEVYNQPQADVLDNLAEEDDAPACQPQVIELEEGKDTGVTGVTETQEIAQQSHAAASEELVTEDSSTAVESGNDDIQQTLEQGSVEVKDREASETREICNERTISASEEDSAEDDVTAEGPTSDAREVENRESVEEIKNNTDDNIVEASDLATVEETDQENNMLSSEDVPEQQTRELEPEEVQSTEPVEPQGISPSHIASTSEESTPEDNVTAEPSPDSQAENLESATVTEETKDVKSNDAVAEEETPEEHVQEFEAPVHTPPAKEPELEETKNTDNQMDAVVLENPTHEDNPATSESLVIESAEVSSSEATEGQELPQSEVTQSEDYGTEENTIASEPKILEPELAEEMRDSEATEPRSISEDSIVSSSEESVPEEDVTAREPASDIKEVQTEEPELIEEHNDAKAGEISNQISGTIVGEAAQENLEPAKVTEETRDVKSTDAIAEEDTPEEHVQEFEAPVDTPSVEEPELEETKNTEPDEVHDNVATNDLPAEEVNNTEATETAEIQNESGDLTEDVKSNVALEDEAAPEEDAKATEATAGIPQAQEPEQEEIKDSEPVEVEDDKIASDLAEEEIKDTEAMQTEVIPDESTSAKNTELTNALAEEAAPEEHVTETEATIDIPGAREPELEEIKNTEPVEVKENISASDLPTEEVKETEVINESTDANISEPTEDAETNVALADEVAPEEHVIATEATDDIPRAQEPELEETKNTEPIEMKENISASDLPAEEVKETEATETEVISESTVANISEPTEDAETNVALADVEAPDEHAKATEATADKQQAQDPALEEIKNSEPIEVEDNITASDLPEEEIKDTEAIETEVIPDESTSAKITELTNDVKSNITLAEEAAPEEYVTETEATIHIPGAQEPELEEIKNTEPVEVKENISASDLPAEEVKETEVISESTDANISEPTEDAETNVSLADEAAPEENVIATEATVDTPRAQEPQLEEIENAEHVEVEENISANDLPAEENFTENEPQMTDIEPTRPEPTPNESNVASLEEMATEDNTRILTDVTIQQLQEQEPVEFRDTEATSEEPAPEDNVTTEVSPDIQAENLESEAVTEEAKDVNSTETIAEEETPEEHVQEFESPVDIPPAEQPELEEAKNTEPVEVHDNVMTNDLPAEEVKDTQATEIVEIHNESGDLTEDVKTNVALTDETAPDEDAKATEPTADIPQAEEPELEEIKNSEPVEVEDNIIAREMPEEEIKDTEAMETEMIPVESTGANISEITDDLKSNIALADEAAPEEHVIETEATIDIPGPQELELEEIKNTEPAEVKENISASDLPAEEVKETEATETEVISERTDANISEPTEDTETNVALPDEAVPEENVIATEATIDVPRAQEPELEEIKNTEPVNVEENISATDQSAEETEATEAMESEAINESIDANNSDATEREEASHQSQDAGLEKLVSESNAATLEPNADIQQVSDLDVVEEMTAAEAINDEEISCKKTEVATLEDQSPTELDKETLENEINKAEPTEQKDESSDLGEKAAFTTPEGESPTEEDAQTSGEDTVGILNNIEQIKDQSKAVIEHDAIQSADHTNDQDDEQLHNAELQTEVCERSLDVSAIEQPDEDVQKVKDQQQNEDEAIEKQTEEIQSDEQKHDDRSADLTTETLMEPQSSEIGTANLHEDTDVFEPEQALHTPQGSIPSIPDVKVEDSTEIEETPEQENATNNTDTLYADADAEKYNEREKENIEIDAAVAKLSVDEQDGPTDETINEEVGNGMASPIEKDLQKSSDPAPSNEEMLENDTTVVHENVEPRVHREERECINKANDDMQAIQASEEEIVDEVEKKQEMQNEDTDVNNDEVQTKHIDEEASELHSNDSTYSKMDDTMSPYAEMEEVEDNKGFSNTSEYVVEKSEQNDVAQDLSIHPKVVEVETNSNEEMATSYTAVTEAVKFDEAIDDKASGADGALSDENLKTIEDNRRNLEASPVATESGETMNEDNEYHNLALPAYSGVDGNTTEQASGSEVTERGLLFSEKPLPSESELHEESQTTKEQDEEDIHEQETGDTEKEDEQSELPVSNFLMNLIMGKESTEPDEAENKQEETTKDDSCLITSQLEENLVPIPTENKVDSKLIFEQGIHNLEGSEETHDSKLESDEVLSTNTHNLEAPVGENNVQGEVSSELVQGGSGLMTELGEKATDSEKGSLNNNLDDSTNPKVSQEDTLEEGRTDLQHESLPEDISSDAVAEQTLLSRELNTSDEKKLPKDNDDLQSPLSTKREEATESSITEAESTVEAELENEAEKEEEKQHTTNTGGGTEGQVESLHDNSQKETEAISDEQKAEITEPIMGTELNLVHEKEISAGSECEKATQSSKLSDSELHNSEKALDIQSDDSSLHINQDKQDEFAGDKIVMEKNNLLDKPGESNLHEEQEIEIGQESPKESDGVDQNCLAITVPVIKEGNANTTAESHVPTVNTKSSEGQEILMSQVQERGVDVVSQKEAPEAEEDIVQMAKPEFSTDEEQISKEDKSNMAGEKTEKTKDEEKAKSFTDEVKMKIEEQGAVQKASHNQTRDLNVVLPTEAPGSEESFVDVKTPEFSTDEEQSPKKDESDMAEKKSYDEKTNSTDEAPMKIEEREAGQKASPKKHNILSGVGSKVKHQLAKVKKAIIGKPSHTKSESPKS